MTAKRLDIATAGSGMKWVGRAIRRFEDPALVRGRGRFTGDLSATHFVRFVRSPVAAGRIVNIAAPDGITIIRAADLGARPIRPMLHKYNYLPIAQPILAAEVVRFVGNRTGKTRRRSKRALPMPRSTQTRAAPR
jgi:carbon-monoxide dehydrogenase large subunit